MIRCFFRKKETSSTENFDEFGPELLDRLTSSLKDCEEDVVLRVMDDEAFFDLGLYRASTQQSAEQSVTAIVGSTAVFWGQTFVATDGDGWRMIWAPTGMNSQMKQTPGAFGTTKRH